MNQQAFEDLHRRTWQRYDAILTDLGRRRNSKKRLLSADVYYDLPALYRRICQHCAIARQRNYSPNLVEALQRRVQAGHERLYSSRGAFFWRILEFFWVTFPVQLRRHWRHFWLATALFYVPAFAFGLACYLDSSLIYSILPESQVHEMQQMYDPGGGHVGRSAERASDTDLMMFGFYIYNNTGIGFRTFAMGMLAGLGTVFTLAYNGLVIGGVAGHLTQLGFIETFWGFVSGHGSFELTAICISGAAGLRLAQPLYAPGRYSRLEAFRLAGRDSIQLVMGAGTMFFIAAFIEAFWSSSTGLPLAVKYAVAAALWLLVIAYLYFGGRGYADSSYAAPPSDTAEEASA